VPNRKLEPGPPAWLPLHAAANSLGVSRRRAIRLARSGRVIARLVGGRRWFFRNDSVARFAARRRRTREKAA
jgi:predicted site-specific integrase-resolvase